METKVGDEREDFQVLNYFVSYLPGEKKKERNQREKNEMRRRSQERKKGNTPSVQICLFVIYVRENF